MTSRLRSVANFSVHEKASIGDTKISMKGEDHEGWLLCNGRSMDIYLFAQLYNIIRTNYGGSGITFNLPNPKGRVLGVVGSGPALTTRNQGATVGAETHLLTEAQLPAMTKTTITNSGHTHVHNCNANPALDGVGADRLALSYYSANGANSAGTGLDSTVGEPNLFAGAQALNINTENAHTHTIQIGSSQVHNNMQPTMFVGNMFIYCGRPNVGTYPYTFKDYKYYRNAGTR